MLKFAKTFVIITISVMLIMGISYLFAVANLIEMNDEVRTNQDKAFVPLSHGSVSYEWAGPKDGELIVMVHGFSTPSVVFMHNVDALAEAGFRVLTYDHYGRGYSDRPNLEYGKKLYDNELNELLNALEIDTQINLIGYSLGGGISAAFAAEHPERVKRLVLIAPVGFIPEHSGINRLLLVPVLGEWLMAVGGKQLMINSFYAQVDQGIAPVQMAETFEKQFNYTGVERALLSTMRNYPMSEMHSDYKKLGETSIPKLLIWGIEDSTVPFEGSEELLPLVPDIQLFTIEGAQHSIPYSDDEVVNSKIIEFLVK